MTSNIGFSYSQLTRQQVIELTYVLDKWLLNIQETINLPDANP